MVPLELKGFSDIQLVAEQRNSSFFRAKQDKENRLVLVATLKQVSRDIAEDVILSKEFKILNTIDLPGVPKPIELLEESNRTVLLMEHVPGLSLERYCDQASIPLPEFLKIAISIASNLGDFHAMGFMHKDLSPQHLLIDPGTFSTYLLGFSKASHLSAEQATAHQMLSRNNFAYLSPEQTGRMNRSVDQRTDLYSLGIIFFEMLTGKLPFDSLDPLEVVHAHIAKKIPSLLAFSPDIPEILVAIIEKLTEKVADDRYQSAIGLLHDLKSCQRFLTAQGSIPSFVLGQEDIDAKFRIPETLYGREEEKGVLMEAYTQVETGDCQLMFINGYSGVGKTALVNEVHKPTARQKGYFISGKFDQFKNNIPFYAFSLAFNELSQYLLSEPEHRLQNIRENLLQALGANASVLIELIPEFELIIGEQPPSQSLNVSETQNRFFFTLFEFVRVFAQKEHPLCIFIDDLQWCDDASLRLIKELIVQDIPYLFIIGSYRDNEVGEGHPLSISMDEINKVKPFKVYELKPLELLDVQQMVADTLDQSIDVTAGLSAVIFKQTGGNPFHISTLLKSLHSDSFIYFDYKKRSWQWKMKKISGGSVGLQVLELMTRRLEDLHISCLSLLKVAACLGNIFDLKTLALLEGQTPDRTAQFLLPAVYEDIIIPVGHDYLLVTDKQDFGLRYRFQHDRLQQAVYNRLQESERKQLHRAIGQLLLGQEDHQDNVIQIVQHLNEALELTEESEDKLQLAMLNLQAGQKAQAAVAYETALHNYKTGIALLPEDVWTKHRELVFGLYQGFAQCAYLSQYFEEAEQAIDLLLAKTENKLEKVKIISSRLRQYTTIGKIQEAVTLGIEALKLLGYHLPENPSQFTVLKEVLLAKWNLGKRKPMDLLTHKVLKDPEKLAAARLMMELGPAAYILGNSNLYGLTNLKVVNLSLKHGICPESCFAFVSFGAVLGEGFGQFALQEEFGQLGIAISYQLNDIEYRCRTLAAYGVLTLHLNTHWKDIESFYKKGIAAGYASGDLFFLAYCANQATPHHPSLPLLDNISAQHKYRKITLQLGYEDAIDSSTLTLQYTKAIVGETNEPMYLDSDAFSYESCMENMRRLKNYSGIGLSQIHQSRLFLMHEQYEAAYQEAKKANAHRSAMFSLINLEILTCSWFFSAAGLYHSGYANRRILLREMKKLLMQMKKWAAHKPENFLHWQHLMEAELMAIREAHPDAARLYEKAIQLATDNGWLNIGAFANEVAAKYYMRRELHTSAKAYFQYSYDYYLRWQAFSKLEQLTYTYPRYFDIKVRAVDLLKRAYAEENTMEDAYQSLDVATLFKSHQAISGEIELHTLLEKMMQITMMNAGAENGMLLLLQDGELFLQAQAIGEQLSSMQNQPIESIDNFPYSVINYVSRTREAVVLDNAAHVGQFTEDPYIQERKPKSVLCQPIILLNKLYGILYLENNLTVGAFTADRLKTLSLLTSQMAISLQNAQLYASLEEKVHERTTALRAEKKKSDELLHNILPEEVAQELKTHGYAKARRFEHTTVMFTDFTNFTTISASLSPEELVQRLNEYFTVFDRIVVENGLEKIKTIGDAFMAVSGMPNENKNHALDCVRAAIQINAFVQERLQQGGLFDVRIGLSSGPVVAGIVGVNKFAYDIWGSTVNMASRMESSCPPGRINISETTYQLVKESYSCTHRGQIEAKNMGIVDMYLLDPDEPLS